MTEHHYQPTEAKYKDGADEMYITYDLPQRTRGDNTALFPKVKRVYIAGKVIDWHVGNFEKQSGKKVHGVQITYEQGRDGYERSGYTARRSDTGTEYEVPPTHVEASKSRFTQVIEVPEAAENIDLHTETLPARYQDALQAIR